jgi:hypothetical protein
MNFTPNLVVGIVLTLVGLVLTLERMGTVVARDLLQYWPAVLILFGASVVVQALRRGTDAVPDGPRQRPIVAPGSVFVWVIVAILVSTASQRRFVPVGGSQEDRVSLFTVMGRDSRASDATNFRGAEMTSVMGRAELDLRRATLAPGEDAVIDVFGLMGEVRVIVPKEWSVDIQTTPIMGGVRDLRGLSEGAIGDLDRRSRRGSRDRDLEPLGAPEATPAPNVAPPADGTPAAAAGSVAAPATGAVTMPAPGAAGALISGPAPRLIIRGTVMMGALVVRS